MKLYLCCERDKTAPCDQFPSHHRSGGVTNEVGAMIPSAKEVEHARELWSRYFRPTRLASAESLAQRSGARVYLKIESDLPTGSFKPRGALNPFADLESVIRATCGWLQRLARRSILNSKTPVCCLKFALIFRA